MSENNPAPPAPAPRAIVYKPPVEVVAGAARSDLRSVVWMIGCAVLTMLVLGSKPLLAWCNDLPISRASDLALYGAQSWHDAMTKLHVTDYGDTIREALRKFEAKD